MKQEQGRGPRIDPWGILEVTEQGNTVLRLSDHRLYSLLLTTQVVPKSLQEPEGHVHQGMLYHDMVI